MSRQVTRMRKPRVSLVPTPKHLTGRVYGDTVWLCEDTALRLKAYGPTPHLAVKLYLTVRPHHIYRSFA